MADGTTLEVRIHHEPDLAIVRLIGNGSNVYGESIRGELRGVLARPVGRVVLDLSQLSFINSVLIGVIVEFVARVRRESIEMELHEAHGQVLDVLRKCNVLSLLRYNSPPKPRVHVDVSDPEAAWRTGG